MLNLYIEGLGSLYLYAEPCCGSKEELFEFGGILSDDKGWVK
jgi:hypothetical protein